MRRDILLNIFNLYAFAVYTSKVAEAFPRAKHHLSDVKFFVPLGILANSTLHKLLVTRLFQSSSRCAVFVVLSRLPFNETRSTRAGIYAVPSDFR